MTIIFKTELVKLENVKPENVISVLSKYADYGFNVKNIEIIKE